MAKNKKGIIENEQADNVPAIVQSSDVLAPDGGAVSATGEGSVINKNGGMPDEPSSFTEIPPDDDGAMTGGYASVRGKVSSENRTLWIVVAVMCAMCLVVGICSALITGHLMRKGDPAPIIKPGDEQGAIATVVEARERNIVEVFDRGNSNSGSGIVTKMENGKIYVLTNYHMVEGGNPAVRLYGEDTYYEAEIVGYSSRYDVAVITVERVPVHTVYELDGADAIFSRNAEYKNGDYVVAIGNAMSMGIAAYDGIISRSSDLLEYGGRTVPVMRTTAAINAGMSGGALFDMNGRLIGLNTYRMTTLNNGVIDANHNNDVEDTGFVVPMTIVYPIYMQIIEYGDGEEVGAPFMACARVNTSAIGAITFTLTDFGVFTAEYRLGKLIVTSLDQNLAPSGLSINDEIISIGGESVTNDICKTIGDILCYRYSGGNGSLNITIKSGSAEKNLALRGYTKVA